jgi:hypothetical protein
MNLAPATGATTSRAHTHQRVKSAPRISALQISLHGTVVAAAAFNGFRGSRFESALAASPESTAPWPERIGPAGRSKCNVEQQAFSSRCAARSAAISPHKRRPMHSLYAPCCGNSGKQGTAKYPPNVFSNSAELHSLVLENPSSSHPRITKRDEPYFHFSGLNDGDYWY